MLRTEEEMFHQACLRHLREKAEELACEHRDKRVRLEEEKSAPPEFTAPITPWVDSSYGS